MKLNTDRSEWRDAYHWILTLNWPRFALLTAAAFLVLNLIFAVAYFVGGACLAEVPPHSFGAAFFFSAETLATVGYGHVYPITAYGHVVATVELMTGMFWTAVITGLIFVRFSRPMVRILFSECMAIAPVNGVPTLVLRVANLRHQPLAEARFRLVLHRDETTIEGETMRRFYDLKLQVESIVTFPAVLTLRHTMDESSPMHGATPKLLTAWDALFMSSVVCTDTVINTPVQSQHNYLAGDVRFGERFVEVYSETVDGRLFVDYGLIHDTERVPAA
ncbi:MAG: ion channel [Chthoniobacteraceae bacterium]